MFYYNKIKQKNISYKQLNYASFANGINTDYDERLLPVKYATSTYNYCYQNGALKTGIGIKELEIAYDRNDSSKKTKIEMPADVEALATYTYIRYDEDYKDYMDMLLVYGSDKKVYAYCIYFDSSGFADLDVEFNTCPMVANYNINGKDCVILVTEEEGMYVWDGLSSVKKIEDAPAITSMCIHYERMYATVGGDMRSVYFSDDLDPTNWSLSLSEGGFVNLIDERGCSKKIVSFNDSLFIFRDYGIDKMIAYADQTEFQVQALFTSSTKIYTDTIKVCGDRIMFLANDGIYYFTGLSTVKYNLNINSLFVNSTNDKAKASYYNGKYYLACNLKFPDDDVVGCEAIMHDNNILIELDCRSGEINILRGYDVVNLMTLNTKIESKLIICIKEESVIKLGELTYDGKIFGKATTKVWKSPKSNCGISYSNKLLKSISVATNSDIEVIVHTESISKKFEIKGDKKIVTFYPNMKFEELAIDFVCYKSECNISNPQIVVGVL